MTENDDNFTKNLTTMNGKKKKKSGTFRIFRAALLMMRKQSGPRKPASKSKDPAERDPAPPADDTKNNASWTQLVGSVRPLHLQETAHWHHPLTDEKISDAMEVAVRSPARSSTRGTMSQYASASSLIDLDESGDEEEDDPDEVFDALTGDEMIDAKAEEFIAQFYKQMELQKNARAAHHHHHHSRGI